MIIEILDLLWTGLSTVVDTYKMVTLLPGVNLWTFCIAVIIIGAVITGIINVVVQPGIPSSSQDIRQKNREEAKQMKASVNKSKVNSISNANRGPAVRTMYDTYWGRGGR